MSKTTRMKVLISRVSYYLKQQATLLKALEREVFRDSVIATCPATSKQLRRISGWPKKSPTISELRAVARSRGLKVKKSGLHGRTVYGLVKG